MRFTFERELSDPTPYYLQGDEDLHATLPSAQRAALRNDGRVLRELEKFWAVFRTDAADCSISKSEYLTVHAKFAAVLIPDLTPGDVHDAGEEDWQTDVGGADRMDKEQFMNCLFELADMCMPATTNASRAVPPTHPQPPHA